MRGLSARLRALSDEMVAISVNLEYFGGFDAQFREKSGEILAGSRIARQWAEEIEKIDTQKEENHVAQTSVPSI